MPLHTQTIKIPADHRVVIDFPRQIPAGKTLQVSFFVKDEAKSASVAAAEPARKRRVIPETSITETTVKTALALRWKDFEDAVQYAAA